MLQRLDYVASFAVYITLAVMKKFLIAVGASLGLLASPMATAQAAKTPFEAVLVASKKSGDLMPVWERFVNTQFFVVIIRNDKEAKTKDFRFSVFTNPIDKKYYVLVSEHLNRLENAHSGEAIKLSGAQLVQMIQPELGIIVGGLEDGGAFAIPNSQVLWLRKSIQPNR